MKTLATIDCGSNSFHLLVVQVTPGGFETLAKDKEMVRLAANRIEGALDAQAMERGLEALKRFEKLAREHGAQRIVAVATSAVREAPNGAEFLARAEREAGIPLELVSGPEEARLIYLGIASALDFKGRRAAMVDIGGGSTELAIGTGAELLFARSLKVGAVRLHEAFVQDDPPSADQYYRLLAHVKGNLHQVIPQMKAVGYDMLVASSGTALTLGEMALAAQGLPVPRSLNGTVLTREALLELERRLRSMPLRDRQKVPGLPPRRADIIVAGAGILGTVMDELGASELILCDRALREGLVLDVLDREGLLASVAPGPHHVRARVLRQLGERYGYDRRHAEHVTAIALSLFDQTTALHGLGRAEREILEGAALLHDVGFHINHSSHHKHSYYLIRHSELLGFHEPEIELMANIARYHRKSLPRDKHPNFRALSPSQREVAHKLIALLRIADGLDHGGDQALREVSVLLEPRETVFFLRGEGELEVEIWGASSKADGWAKAFGREARFVAVPVLTGTGGTGPLPIPR